MLREEWMTTGANGLDIFMREWRPETAQIRAVVCLVHGMGEHGERFKHVAAQFTEAGIVLIALDQQGHGRSSGRRGHLYSIGAAVSDAALMIEVAGKRHPDLPIFLYGHSMGGNVALNCALRLMPPIKGLILTSPWLRLTTNPHPAVDWFGRKLALIMPKIHQSTGLKTEDLYRPGYDEAASMDNDPLSHTKITLNTFAEVSSSGEWAIAHVSNLQVPMLLMHGSADKVTSFDASAIIAKQLGDQCEFKRFEGGYHELHNDIDGKKMIQQLVKWLEDQL